MPFLTETRTDRAAEIARIAAHVELSLTELLQRADDEIGRAAADVEQKLPGAEGRLAQAESRHAELLARRERRRADLERQRALTLQGVERLTPNERRVAEDRRDCFWPYVVTHCDTAPQLQAPIRDPARLDWHEVSKVQHYYLSIDAMQESMQVREDSPPYGGSS
ncbi:MAG: hypothetical protein IT530_14895 [Burkholderiales bacterium]|nr:hypothetical protein [Burkholderiales bacterium]